MITKYTGQPAPDPHTRLTALDEGATAYWLEDVTLMGGFKLTRKADVVAHTPDWLTLRDEDGRDWTIACAHIVCFRIAEG